MYFLYLRGGAVRYASCDFTGNIMYAYHSFTLEVPYMRHHRRV